MEAYIIKGFRSAVGKAKKGGFKNYRSDDLAVDVIKHLVSKVPSLDVKKVDDVVKIGDKVKVKLIKIDDLKRLDFSMKALMEKPDNYSSPEKKAKFQKG